MSLKHMMMWLVVFGCALPDILTAQEELQRVRVIELPILSLSPVGAGARAAGKGFAFIGVADDATAASHNPGGLARLERPEFSVVGSNFHRLERPDGSSDLSDQAIDKFSLDFLSVAIPFHLLGFNVVASLQLQRLFDQKDSVDIELTRRVGGQNSQLRFRRTGSLLTISPAVAVQLTRSFSVGVAFNIWPDLFDNGWETETRFSVANGGELISKSDFSVEGFNFTAGFLWKIHPVFTLGGVVRSPFDATVTHTKVQEGPSGQESFTETLVMEMPLSYGLGLSARLSDLLTISLDVLRVHWSDFRLESPSAAFFRTIGDFDVVVLPNFRRPSRGDVTSVRLGAEYLRVGRGNIIPFRAGVFYDPEPSFKGIDNFFGFSLGTGIVKDRYVFDVAYIFRTGNRTELVVVENEMKVDEKTVEIYEHSIITSLIIHF